jgi:hypothetical protein
MHSHEAASSFMFALSRSSLFDLHIHLLAHSLAHHVPVRCYIAA